MAESPSELQAEIEKLEARHAEHPEGRFFVPLANAYRKTGEVERAEAVLREGLRRHPDYLSAHIVLGRCLADRGATEEATQEFRHVLSIDPQNLIALRTLGELAVKAGRPGDSAQWYEQLLEVDPMNEDARRALENLPAEEPAEAAPESAGAEWWSAASASPAPDPYGGMIDLADDPAGDDAEPLGAEPGGEVVTETIAELYARQGLNDRAVEVYRELIRRRGGDPALERRLAELTAPPVEETAPAPEPTTAEPEPEPIAWTAPEPAEHAEPEPLLPEPLLPEPVEEAPEPAPYDEPLPVLGEIGALPDAVDDLSLVDADPFASSFEYGFLDDAPATTAAEESTELEPVEPLPVWSDAKPTQTVVEPEPPAAAPPARRTIAAYLGELAAWHPGAGGHAVEVEAEPEESAPVPVAELVLEAEAELVVEVEAELVLEADAEPVLEADAEPVSEPASSPETEVELPESWVSRASIADLGEPASAPVAAMGEDEPLFPWETPAGSTSDTSAEVAEMAPEDEPFPFDSFFDELDSPEAPAAELLPAEPEPAPPPPAPEPATVQEEDDDLESFQAWLRSLKR